MTTIDGVVISSNQTFVNLSGRGLTTFPAELLALTNIEHLDLSNNNITSVPAGITSMTNLRYLILANNQLTTLPISLTSMSIVDLDVSNNPITVLDVSLANLLHTNFRNPQILIEVATITVQGAPPGTTAKAYMRC